MGDKDTGRGVDTSREIFVFPFLNSQKTNAKFATFTTRIEAREYVEGE